MDTTFRFAWLGGLFLTLTLVCPAFAAADERTDRLVASSLEQVDALEQIIERTCRRECGEARRRIAQLRANLFALSRPETPSEPEPIAMDPGRFQSLLSRVSDAGSSSHQIETIRFEARMQFFTAAQVTQLLALLSFSETQLEALRALAPRLVDPERGGEIAASLSFSATQTEARRILVEAWPDGGRMRPPTVRPMPARRPASPPRRDCPAIACGGCPYGYEPSTDGCPSCTCREGPGIGAPR
jgi:hypothetical protein